MRLLKLWIDSYKNLRDLRINFADSPYTVLVGENGAGKSNLLEAIAYIFRNLDLNDDAPFGYELTYTCRGFEVYLQAARDEFPAVQIRRQGEEEFRPLKRSRFVDDIDEMERPRYRPARVFGYYSGPGDRLSELFEKHRERYYDWIIRNPERRRKIRNSSVWQRRLFYARNVHGQFALLAFFMNREDSHKDREFLREHLWIDGLESVLIALRQPPWNSPEGDPRFWNAEGTVRDFLSRVYDSAFLPMRAQRRIALDLKKNPEVESLYLFLKGSAALAGVYDTYSTQYDFFSALESTSISKLLAEVRARVRMTPQAGGGIVTYRDLSEGEHQLLLVLGLLRFTAEEETLFLLDEPDTHLNPAWSAQYLAFLERFVAGGASSHILMTSHDPLVFASLTREKVQILRRREDGCVVAAPPEEDPEGMGVEAILTSDLFRLRTTQDKPTQQKLDRWQELVTKDLPLNSEERNELDSLRAELEGKGFMQTMRDPEYRLFRRAWQQLSDPQWRDAIELTPDQLRARKELARSIVVQMKAERRAADATHTS
jgi:predicted ATPase